MRPPRLSRPARAALQRLSPRHRWWAMPVVSATLNLAAGAVVVVCAMLAPWRWVAVVLAVLAGFNLASALWRITTRGHERDIWRWGWGVGFAAAWHTQHVIDEGGVPGPVLRAMLHDEGSPVPEPWDDWTADLHAPTDED